VTGWTELALLIVFGPTSERPYPLILPSWISILNASTDSSIGVLASYLCKYKISIYSTPRFFNACSQPLKIHSFVA
jgi:hypothetical protein